MLQLQVVKYAEEHGNRQAERHFGPPPTEKMIRTWRGQKEALQNSRKEKRAERGKNAKWPELEYSVLKWVQENRHCHFYKNDSHICNQFSLCV